MLCMSIGSDAGEVGEITIGHGLRHSRKGGVHAEAREAERPYDLGQTSSHDIQDPPANDDATNHVVKMVHDAYSLYINMRSLQQLETNRVR